jgi:hypothetical protein
LNYFLPYFQVPNLTNMKKYLLLMGIVSGVFVFSNCSSSKKTAAAQKVTYANEVSAVIMRDCTPCHVPSKGGNKKAYDNYANAKADIDEIIRRISLNPGEKGFMPFKHPKLPDTTIAVFTKWKADGLPETR